MPAARAKAEARRRAADHQADVENALSTYLVCGAEALRLREEAKRAEVLQAEALADLADLVGRSKAAKMLEVDESKVRSALARRKILPSPPLRPGRAEVVPQVDPSPDGRAVLTSVPSPGES